MRITFANNYTTPNGRHYLAGHDYDVNDDDARSLIFRGTARRADAEGGAATAATPEPHETDTDKEN
jgi:hypothetical protein